MRHPATSIVSNAKINLFLEVVGGRADGYHDIVSVMHEIDLSDRLSCRPRDDADLTLETAHPTLPIGGDNHILAAARLLSRRLGARRGLHFLLEKNIPVGGGLGGGSSNAAAALRLADRLWEAGLSDAALSELAARIGSDAPFFVRGGLALAEGRGEILTPLDLPPPDFPITLFLTNIHSRTARAYSCLRLPGRGQTARVDGFLDALRSGDPAAVSAVSFNRFEKTVLADIPALGGLHRFLEKALARRVLLTGSGSTLWSVGPAGPALERLERECAFQELRNSLALRTVEARFVSRSAANMAL
ncbi:MAG: 4-(cytidine 5'-diphospho)-2-C-methyl-D-erythritol kinase [Planctomycetota bacterium]|jgi:4-diphosphocytidyl-2-C-methyl-D-erythritol kinase|nr:4-(cytidine 5'-diphospho)-2-C-methyl-D-erythritol kinase [Planctomycetota bacterium]